jgi:hypothetical protein
MSFDKIYVTILTNAYDVTEDEVDALIRDTFIKEYQQGGRWGSVIRDSVERNVDLDVQIATIFSDITDDEQAKMIARQAFRNYAPQINPDDHTDFVLRNTMLRDGEDCEMILYLVLVDEMGFTSRSVPTDYYQTSTSTLKKDKQSFYISVAGFIVLNIYAWFFMKDPSSLELIVSGGLSLLLGLNLFLSGYRSGMRMIWPILIFIMGLLTLVGAVWFRGFL